MEMETKEPLETDLDVENSSEIESENKEQEVEEENDNSTNDCQNETVSNGISFQNFRNDIGIIKILATSSSYHDIHIRCSRDERIIPVNRLVLASASTLFRNCLPDTFTDEESQVSLIL